MALQKSYEDRSGTTHASAYHMITAVNSRNLNTDPEVVITVSIFHDNTARQAGKEAVDDRFGIVNRSVSGAIFNTYFAPAVLNTVDKNIRSQAYEYLKTEIAYYTDAQDV